MCWLVYNNQLSGLGGEGNATPLQYSCLENPMDGGPTMNLAAAPIPKQMFIQFLLLPSVIDPDSVGPRQLSCLGIYILFSFPLPFLEVNFPGDRKSVV